MRKRDGGKKEREKENGERKKREKVSRGLSVTRGVERRVTQVQSSAPACPRAIPAQQRQEAAEDQWLQQRQVGWNHKHTDNNNTRTFIHQAHNIITRTGDTVNLNTKNN